MRHVIPHEEIQRRKKEFGGWWETHCAGACATEQNVGHGYGIPDEARKLGVCRGCDQPITIHVWHPGKKETPKPHCETCTCI